MFKIVLYCIVMYCVVSYYIVLYFIVLTSVLLLWIYQQFGRTTSTFTDESNINTVFTVNICPTFIQSFSGFLKINVYRIEFMELYYSCFPTPAPAAPAVTEFLHHHP